MNIKLTSLDNLFSLVVRNRAGWKCVRCRKVYDNRERGTPNYRGLLQCSHYWNRFGRANTRFDFVNCDALCYSCHYGNSNGWEYEKQGSYRDFMLKKLGEEGYKALEHQSRQVKQWTQKELRELRETLKIELQKHERGCTIPSDNRKGTDAGR